jgi:hypothetical protein
MKQVLKLKGTAWNFLSSLTRDTEYKKWEKCPSEGATLINQKVLTLWQESQYHIPSFKTFIHTHEGK